MPRAVSSKEEHEKSWRVRLLVVGGWLTLALFANELFNSARYFYSRLGQMEVLQEISDSPGLLAGMAADGLFLLTMALLSSVLPCFVWAAISLVAYDPWRNRFGHARGGNLLFWLATSFVFFRVWYTIHQTLIPGSAAFESPVFVLVGAHALALELTDPSLYSVKAHSITALSTFVLFGLTFWTLKRSRSLRYSLAALAVLIASATAVYSFGRTVRSPEVFTASNNVILLGLDSFQMNRLPVGGADDEVEWAPHINDFLEESRRFDNAWTPFARTYPSWISILTGRYPPNHGVRYNLMPDERIAEDNTYLAAELSRAGYSTLYATDETRFSIIRKKFGFADVFAPRAGLSDLVLTTMFDFSAANLLRQTRLGHDLFPAVANNRASVAYNPRIWAKNLISHLDRTPRDQPAFMAIHLCGNHWPFTTPPPYSLLKAHHVHQSMKMVDDQVASILDYLEASGLRERSTIIMLSDHGDGFSGDSADSWNDHGNTFDRVFASKVILAAQGPGIEPGVVDALVRTIDIHPTVLDLVGIDRNANDVDGRTLLGGLYGSEVEPRDLFAETGLAYKMVDVKRLVDENAKWYSLDPASGLMHMRPEGVDEFTEIKEYMYIRGQHRLVVAPHLNRIQLFPFDEKTGLDQRWGGLPVKESDRYEMLAELAEHFDLDFERLKRIGLRTAFLIPPPEDPSPNPTFRTEPSPARISGSFLSVHDSPKEGG